ncbi:hypothetical protein [Streptococcus marmotae]|uniref:hypothetical protein n=1 Tax=Streptococcus marmotae TaxID=1825069 RepID=UPI00082E99C8|nr:hypothetical protein [Streptococcus marmotae]
MKVNHKTVKTVSMVALAKCVSYQLIRHQKSDGYSRSSMVKSFVSSSQSKSTTSSTASVSETKDSTQPVVFRQLP